MGHETCYLIASKEDYDKDPKRYMYAGYEIDDDYKDCTFVDGVFAYADMADFLIECIEFQNFKKAKIFLRILDEMTQVQKKMGEEQVCVIQTT